ncbi:hypothetical protein J7F01_07255 [Streptomyces sp. ISL-22]|uniref:hypothetical protein n=1 Tax=unclassified Streptomyces TaxID=2593676 RepID=UPI001BE6F0C4|nr:MULTISPECIES: hypothetical protein [unclassified Streptomyces]MBT2418302.1 hypothetical protein [Streptomyces sp. ISL-24]MBT2431998.1 hypothetical protein [Streptomyces sp. ISL-22]
MHRTTTTATLLVTVAVSALSGCMTVPRPAVPGPPTTPAQPSAPRSDEPTAPSPVQAPAREALALIGPSRTPSPTASAAPSVPPAAPPAAHPPAAPRSHPHSRPDHPEPRRPAAGAPKRPPRVEIPEVSDSVRAETPRNSDVCALGRKYGGWQADSPEAVICRQTYGH